MTNELQVADGLVVPHSCPENHEVTKVLLCTDMAAVFITRIPRMEKYGHKGCAYIDLSINDPRNDWLRGRMDYDYPRLDNAEGECTWFSGHDWGFRVGLDNNHWYKYSDEEFEAQAMSWYYALINHQARIGYEPPKKGLKLLLSRLRGFLCDCLNYVTTALKKVRS
jgi:hypothetical protein